eukprot:365202-Chlamydomonas_euryale.AAC.22
MAGWHSCAAAGRLNPTDVLHGKACAFRWWFFRRVHVARGAWPGMLAAVRACRLGNAVFAGVPMCAMSVSCGMLFVQFVQWVLLCTLMVSAGSQPLDAAAPLCKPPEL